MRNINLQRRLILSAILLAGGCAATSTQVSAPGAVATDLSDLAQFCGKNNLSYSFDTIDDIIRLYSSSREIRLLLNSKAVYVDGSIFTMTNMPVYSGGRIRLPVELGKIIFSQEAILLKPVFSINTILVDAGHGGKDPGAISRRGVKEKNINLQVAKYLKEELEKKGFKAVLSRSTDTFLTLQERVDAAKCCKADLFLSVHSNASRTTSLSGMEIYYLTPSRLDSRQRALELAKGAGDWPKVPLETRVIVWDMLLTKNYSLSVDTAHALYYMFKSQGFIIKPPKEAPYYVLRLAYVPAVLVEIGYLSNRYEEKVITRDYYQRQIAEAIAKGVAQLNQRHKAAGEAIAQK